MRELKIQAYGASLSWSMSTKERAASQLPRQVSDSGGEGGVIYQPGAGIIKRSQVCQISCVTEPSALLCKGARRYRQSEFCATALGNHAINDLLFLSVREARLLKIIARSRNDPPLGKTSETGRVLTICRMADELFQGGAAPARPCYPTLLGHCDWRLVLHP